MRMQEAHCPAAPRAAPNCISAAARSSSSSGPCRQHSFCFGFGFVGANVCPHPEVAFMRSVSFMNQSKAASSHLLSTVRAGRSRQKSQARKQNAHGGSRHTWSSAAAPLAAPSMGAGTSGRSARGIVAWSASATYSTCGHRRVGLCWKKGSKCTWITMTDMLKAAGSQACSAGVRFEGENTHCMSLVSRQIKRQTQDHNPLRHAVQCVHSSHQLKTQRKARTLLTASMAKPRGV